MGSPIKTDDYGYGYDAGYHDGREDGYAQGWADAEHHYEERIARLNAEFLTLQARIAVLERNI